MLTFSAVLSFFLYIHLGASFVSGDKPDEMKGSWLKHTNMRLSLKRSKKD